MAGYALNQCALFKVRSKGRLADLLNISLSSLINLTTKGQYKIFKLPASVCEFTGKPKNERQVEEPKGELRRVHDRIRDLLSRSVLVDYAHAAVKGRSYRTNAQAHEKSDVVATYDVSKFYPSTSFQHVFQFFFKEMQCSADVSDLLAKIICFRSAVNQTGCLPTGSPASPIVSVYANKPMFDELDKLAKSTNLRFTCYVDDLTFSGAQLPPHLSRRVNSIVTKYNQKLNLTKTKIFAKGRVKHVTGVIIKDGKISVPASRLKKARIIQSRIAATSDIAEQMRLGRKLSGLLGEAAYLDKSYASMAKASYQRLTAASMRPVTTFNGTTQVSIARPATENSAASPSDGSSVPWA